MLLLDQQLLQKKQNNNNDNQVYSKKSSGLMLITNLNTESDDYLTERYCEGDLFIIGTFTVY